MCNGKKKKGTVFLLGGLFGKTAALPTAAEPSKGFEGALTSPLLKPLPSLPTSYFLSYAGTPHLPLPDHQRPAAELRSGLASGPWETFYQGARSRQTRWKRCTLGTLTPQHLFFLPCLYGPGDPPPHGRHPSDRLRICASAGHSQGCGCHPALRRILTAHVEEILVVFEGGSQFDTTGYKFC